MSRIGAKMICVQVVALLAAGVIVAVAGGAPVEEDFDVDI